MHHADYIDYYSGSKSKTLDGSKLDSIRQTLKSYLEHLQKWGIVKRLQDVDAESGNGTKTPLYGYGRVGMIIARILEYRDKSDFDGKQEAKNKIFYLIQNTFIDPRVYNAYKTDFLAEFYHKLIEYDNNNNNQPSICDSVIRQIIAAMKNKDDIHAKAIDYLKNVLKTILLKPVGDLQIKQTILRLYLQTLNVPEDTRRMTMRHDKTFFESKMEMLFQTKNGPICVKKISTNTIQSL